MPAAAVDPSPGDRYEVRHLWGRWVVFRGSAAVASRRHLRDAMKVRDALMRHDPTAGRLRWRPNPPADPG